MLYDLASYISCMALLLFDMFDATCGRFSSDELFIYFFSVNNFQKHSGICRTGTHGSLVREILKLGGCHVAEGEGRGRAG